MCGDDLDDVECGTIHASGSIPIQIDYYYFEFKVLEMKPNCDIIIGMFRNFQPVGSVDCETICLF